MASISANENPPKSVESNLERSFALKISEVETLHDLKAQIDKFFGGQYAFGEDVELELSVRNVLNQLMDHCDNPDSKLRGKWLSMILTRYTSNVDQQAILIYLMFGPVKQINVDSDVVSWIMWEEPTNQNEVNDKFKPLAHALSLLYSIGSLESSTISFMLMDPNEPELSWTEQSVANLLVFMSQESRIWFLQCRNSEEAFDDSALIMSHLLVVNALLKLPPNDIHETIKTVCTEDSFYCQRHKKELYDTLCQDLAEQRVDVAYNDEEKALIMKAVNRFGLFLMKLAYSRKNATRSNHTEE